MARIEFEDVIRLLSRNHLPITQTSQSASLLRSRMLNFVNSTGFEGAGARQMANYMTEVHGYTLEAMQSVLLYYLAVLERFNNDLSEVDPNDNTIIDMAYLDDFTGQIQPLQRRFEETSLAVRTWYQWAWDLVFRTSAPDPDALVEYITQCWHITVEQMNRMRDLDSTYSNAFDEIVRLLNGIDQVLDGDLLTVNGLNVSFDYQTFTNNIKEGLIISDEAVQRVADTFFSLDENGNVIFDDSATIDLFMQQVFGGSEFQYRVLLAIHMDMRLSYDNIRAIYERIGMRIAGTGIDQAILDASQNILRRIEIDISERLFYELEESLWGRSEICDIVLEDMLLRAQLTTFIGSIPSLQWNQLHSMNLDNFGPRSVIGGIAPTITFNGVDYRGTRFAALTCQETFFRNLVHGSFLRDNARELEGPDWLMNFLYLGMIVGGNIKKIAKKAGFRVIKHVMNGMTVYYIIDDATGERHRITAAEAQHIERMRALGILSLGGGGAAIETPPSGSVSVIGTTSYTQTAMIRLAALAQQGISEAQAIQGIVTECEVLTDFLEGNNTILSDFENGLAETLDYLITYNYIVGVSPNTSIFELDLNVLEYLINTHIEWGG